MDTGSISRGEKKKEKKKRNSPIANLKSLQLLCLALCDTRSPLLAARGGKEVVSQLLYASFELWSYFPVYRGQLTKDGKTGHMYVKLPLKLQDSC